MKTNIKLTQKDINDYLYNCFVKTDGLWFVKIEEMFGFDAALKLDVKVWEVIPKMQARFIKERLAIKMEDKKAEDLLFYALRIKLTLDRFEFKIIKNDGFMQVIIKRCPWHDILIKAKRENISAKIGSRICAKEFSVFASEFYPQVKIEFGERICFSENLCKITYKF